MYKYILIVISLFFYISIYTQNDTVLIDFGNTLSPAPWNNVTNSTNGSVNNLINNKGFSTPYNISVYDSFKGINNSGTTASNQSLGIHSNASSDSFFGNTHLFNGSTEPTGAIELSNLDTSKNYTISIFSSRIATDNRETMYVFIGQVSDTLYLNVSSNTINEVVSVMKPDSSGSLKIKVSEGPNNDNSYGFFYLGVMKISYSHIPLGPQSLALISPNGGETWQSGKTPSIIWQSDNISSLILEYSINNGNSWITIDTVTAYQNSYSWQVPNLSSINCLIKLSSDSLLVQSISNFEITHDTGTCIIVVLGSSTAAGAGTSHPDSTWVNRYRKHISQNNTKYEVINLAKGGYTTYHILPTGSIISAGISITIDTARNITKALTYNPYSIIVNMPSNDAANNFSVQQQLDNFNLMSDTANANDADIWICTTQPRNFSNFNQIQIQKDTKDSILAIYGNNAIDFWNGFADINGHIDSIYDSGDGVHMNDLGHFVLYDRVMSKQIHSVNCNSITSILNSNKSTPFIKCYPNPFTNELNFKLDLLNKSDVSLKIFNVRGVLVYSKSYKLTKGNNEIKLHESSNLFKKNNLYFTFISISNQKETNFYNIKIIKQ
jgi:hypothetical protein